MRRGRSLPCRQSSRTAHSHVGDLVGTNARRSVLCTDHVPQAAGQLHQGHRLQAAYHTHRAKAVGCSTASVGCSPATPLRPETPLHRDGGYSRNVSNQDCKR
jgi:hypothetical protein